MRRGSRYILAAVAALFIAVGAFLAYYVKTLGPKLKQRVVNAVAERFDADVTLGDLQFSLFPLPRVEGKELVIKHRHWGSDAHPLIRIARFEASTDFTTIVDWRNRVNQVTLEGLEIHIPPRGRATLKSRMLGTQEVADAEPGHDTTQLKFLIQSIVADNALVEIEPKKQGKDPLQFPIEKLIMHSVGPGRPMTFTARLFNAKPPGAIETAGHFGPWQRDDPRSTAISGDYTFRNADLSVFKGISGTLSSEGKYGGVLQHIQVAGKTDTPNFDLKQEGGTAVHLTTQFHSVVDGTNGDTILDLVDAKFGKSEFLCSGGVVRHGGDRGKTVELDARTKYGRMEDILALLVDGPPVIKGEMQFQSKIVIPPGSQKVAEKLNLDGTFRLKSAVFTSPQAEGRLRTLSDRARGISKSEAGHGQGSQVPVASDLFGKYKLDNALVSFAHLAFDVPGAHIELAGKYNLKSSEVDMKGKFQMHATLSETQSGVKHVLLKPLDRLFQKNGAGFEVPISVAGTRDHPVIGATVFHRRFNIH